MAPGPHARIGARALAGVAVRVVAGVVAIEARALEHDADGVEDLAQATLALGALGQRGIGEGLDDRKVVFARGTRVGVRRHGSSTWHSQGLTAKCNLRPVPESPATWHRVSAPSDVQTHGQAAGAW